LDNFELDIGEMDYGFQIGGILGMDFLRAARAVIDLDRLAIDFASPSARLTNPDSAHGYGLCQGATRPSPKCEDVRIA